MEIKKDVKYKIIFDVSEPADEIRVELTEDEALDLRDKLTALLVSTGR